MESACAIVICLSMFWVERHGTGIARCCCLVLSQEIQGIATPKVQLRRNCSYRNRTIDELQCNGSLPQLASQHSQSPQCVRMVWGSLQHDSVQRLCTIEFAGIMVRHCQAEQ